MSSASSISRRDFFCALFRRKASVADTMQGGADIADEETGAFKAIIQGRFCLAYQKSFCSVCSERCPEDGAIVRENGIPQVNADHCTGCRICYDVCPAPQNAILMISKDKGVSA